MIQIRQKSFETNSSSTHCLVMPVKYQKSEPCLDIEVFKEVNQPLVCTSVIDKLRYFWTAYNQYAWDTDAQNFALVMKSIFSEYNFVTPQDDEQIAYLEDVEWFFEESYWMTFVKNPDLFKNFIESGIIYYDNRDTEVQGRTYWDYQKLAENSSWGICWAG